MTEDLQVCYDSEQNRIANRDDGSIVVNPLFQSEPGAVEARRRRLMKRQSGAEMEKGDALFAHQLGWNRGSYALVPRRHA
ncbi:hypothetical protein GS3922_16070 [Geobacillus subterraneus]|uniref:Uncharacterized protein n=2 Tax=Geobacillus TaxID=129337 RepID=A0ABN4NK15_9BACL|nr:hypothetical protein GS3922_16070 [Geobacillus subterraneus]KZS25678.1 hypothetical protein A5418_04410 [Geobacillus subterraneus]OXB85202.1 hypothetical protein B9L21_16175 [Geobacillus uzenensis]